MPIKFRFPNLEIRKALNQKSPIRFHPWATMITKDSFLGYHRLLIMAAGKWHVRFPHRLLDLVYRAYSLFVEVYCFLMTQDILVSMWMFRNCQERIIELSCYYVQYTNINIMGFLTKRPKTRQVLDYIIAYEEKSYNAPQEVVIYQKYSRINRLAGFTIFFLTILAAGTWYTLVVTDTYKAPPDLICPVFKGLSFQVWYPFDLYNRHYWVTRLADLTLFTAIIFSLTFIRVITVLFMVFVLGQIKILQNMVRSLDAASDGLMEAEELGYDEAVLRAVFSCVKKHQDVQSLMELVNDACKEFIFIGFFSNSMELALFLMKLLIEDSIIGIFRQIVILFMTMTQLFLFLWFANEIKVESSAISDIIYNETNWLNYHTKVRKILIIMMIRSQKPLTCYSAGIGDMTIDTFKNMLKLCYSITTFFKSAFM